jgi:anti-sigma regulatory factor (Ser/Thr protein kinase)
MADDAVLICPELAANAVLHSESARPGGQFAVGAEVCEGDYVWLELEDQGGRWAENESSDLRGRGLEIVVELADYWDVTVDGAARVVYAEPAALSPRRRAATIAGHGHDTDGP